MKSLRGAVAVLFAGLLGAAQAAPATPMVDGDCGEYPALQARQIAVTKDVSLFIHQDEHHVWLCYTYPAGSMGMLDMTLKAPGLADALVLHASVQLGEWPAGRPDLVPANAESELWGKISGWTANTVAVNGLDTSGPTPRLKLKGGKAREVQLSKQRFGQGEWQFRLKIYGIQGAGGTRTDVVFPADGTYFTLKAP